MAKRTKKLSVVFISSEAAPFVKTGGLGDVAGGLTKALAQAGHEVHLITPLYGAIDRKAFGIPARGKTVRAPVSARIMEGNILSIERNGVHVHFMEQGHYFDREGIYTTPHGDFPDNAERFAFFSRAALEAVKTLGVKPDVIHVNDWQTALVPAYLKTVYEYDKVLGRAASVITIHNLGYQGHYWPQEWHLLGLDWALYSPAALEFHGKINFLKGGLVFADIITTVSETYAGQIKAPADGWGLDGVLRARGDSVVGVLNGIDAEHWNPKTDPLIPASYSAAELDGKEKCRRELLREMGLGPCAGPTLGVISRLAHHKGMDILAESLDRILKRDARFVLLGSGDRRLEDAFRAVAARHPEKSAVKIGFDEALSHRIQAGSDIFMVPSLYEPCGLTQMYALAYGAAPLVRATGGLNDTVEQVDPAGGAGTGFKFHDYSAEALYAKTAEALDFYGGERGKWIKMIKRGMKIDNSWNRSAGRYVELYRLAVSGKAGLL